MADWAYPGMRLSDQERNPCDGCHECGMRCTSGVQMSRGEFDAIVAHLRSSDPERTVRVLEQEKQVVWFEEIQREACLFYDVAHRGCIIYPARPLICRLFGRVEWLPCPIERPLKQISAGLQVFQAYARERRATFPEWCTQAGIFDLRRLILGSR